MSPEAVNSRSSARTVLPGQEVGGDVGDVLAVVGGLGPACIARLQALRGAPAPMRQASRSARRRRCNRTRASTCAALRLEQVAHRVAERSLAAMANVQRAGRVGRDELDHHAAAVRPPVAEGSAGRSTSATTAGSPRREVRLMKPGPAISSARPNAEPPFALQRVDQLGSQLARIASLRLGEPIAAVHGEVAMGGLPAATRTRRLRAAPRASCRQALRATPAAARPGLGSSADFTIRALHRSRRAARVVRSAVNWRIGRRTARRTSDPTWRRRTPSMPSPAAAPLRSTTIAPCGHRACRRASASTACSASRRRCHQRGVPGARRLPRARCRDQAGAHRPLADPRTVTTSSASSPPKPRWSAGCSIRTWCRSTTRSPTRTSRIW